MKYITSGAATALVIALAGCAGGPQGTLDGYADDYTDILLAMSNEQMSPIDGANMPTSGTASYSGPILMMATNTDLTAFEYVVWGDIALDADFEAGSVSGEATDFVEVDVYATTGDITAVGAVGGTLDISGGMIDNIGFGSFDSAMMTGDLTGLENGNAYVDMELSGFFYSGNGTDIDVVFGGGSGTSTSTSGVTTIGAVFVAD